ncbi:MAG: phosphotransferase enzyme family protein [Ferrimicrobium sp.]
MDKVSGVAVGLPIDELTLAWPCLVGADVVRVERSENTTWLVDGPGGMFAVRRYRDGYEDMRSIGAELRLMQLAKEALPIEIPGVVPTHRGEEVLRRCDGLYVVFTFLPGEMATQSDIVAQASRIGEIAALLHRSGEDLDRTQRTRWRWDVDALTGAKPRWGSWQPAFAHEPRGYEIVAAAQGEVETQMGTATRAESAYGLLHADLRAANLLVHEGVLTGIIDFDDCGFGWYVYEAVASLSFYETSPDASRFLRGWLAGYAQVRALSPESLALIPTLVIYRRLLLTAWLLGHPHVSVPGVDRYRFGVDTADLADRYLRDPYDIERLLAT